MPVSRRTSYRLRGYRLPTGGRLVEIGVPSATGFSVDENGRWLLDDGTWIEPRCFVEVDASGAEVAVYGQFLRSSALDDYLYVEGVHFVDGNDLVRTMIELGGLGGRWVSRLCGRDVVLRGLTPEDMPADAER